MVFQNIPNKENEEEVGVLSSTEAKHKLVLHNDDFNTFDFVIESLMEVCAHTLEQAEQCTFLVHYKGKCTVKTGNLELIEPMHKKLLLRGLSSEII
ncbi:ATP-dependent Clp protease adaptor ClpS [Riemerella anatipestifer]|uniref:ATP-dependent Clp protease adaptor ClpS n=1 Tax=Riemerella anatipestifer TaxID=34085 RepID=A0AAP6HFL1_RIEAN|nr:ATP-dependent Clp protease adaptor ClpS [Riemerella anatipestifer]MBT0549552.1 ATP-dependent Clp protease adaptor ClpS [Riemerella anatipestifer]MBT0556286.1 ATP-dependent Clp protease adaptor ClpS [Riemerella anatipestifer]MBT0560295.1 ATP-dependent Clp protease adaptor ClpS [Riemerella anatipestifer]MCD5968213.1 ATP-dependent Clp protease adaptor ClpS [Riemerella anatipestifer]MCO7354216.1 ATP-dependent Clp protease adaptor ClpS [Riemerella anatipestifer]